MTRLVKMSKRDKLTLLADIADGLRALDASTVKLIRTLLDDPDARVRAEAITCLWNEPSPRWVNPLIRKARRDPSAEVRLRAISTLGRYVLEAASALDLDEEFWPEEDTARGLSEHDLNRIAGFLLHTAHDVEATVDERRFAIEALAFLDDPEVDGLIEWAFSQTDPRMRVSALFAMGRSGNLRWTEAVFSQLHNADREIQAEAIRAAGTLGLKEATEDLIELARGRGAVKSLRLLAIYALGDAGDDRALPVLDELSHSRDRDIRNAAREAADEWMNIAAAEEMLSEVDTEEEDYAYDELYEKDIWDESLGVFSKN
jgi:HEAT repeat protein